MPDISKNAFEIKLSLLGDTRKKAVEYMSAISYTPSKLASNQKNSQINSIVSMAMSVKAQSNNTTKFTDSIRLLRERFAKNAMIMPTKLNNALLAIQEGLAIALYVKSQYENSSNLTTLQQRKANSGKFNNEEAAEFSAKLETCTAITLFAWASYVTYALNKDAIDGTTFSKFSGIPEIGKLEATEGIGSVIYFLDAYFTAEGMVNTEQDATDLVLTYFNHVANDVTQRKGNFKYADSYTEVTYKLESSEFSITGWESTQGTKAASVVFNKVNMGDIVGNREAKHLAMRTIGAQLSYDFKTRRNPFDEIAKYARIIMGKGFPGTGKSLIIAGTATKMKELCDWLGYPFLFVPFPDNIVSTFQGGSAERAIEWFRIQNNPEFIVYAPIDDAENSLMNRSEQGVSAGVKEVIGVFLRMTEGAYSVDYGNGLIGVYTNLPEKIDPAVMSRIQRRSPIEGAITHNDFLDQNHLWLRKYKTSLSGIVSLEEPANYNYMDDQKVLTNISQLKQTAEELVTHPEMIKIYQKVVRQYPKKTGADYYAALAFEMQKICPYFTSREARNIQTNIDTRLCDFDFPEDWWKDEKIYFHQPYEQKVNMLKELMRTYMAGQSFADIMEQETLKYMNQFISINLTEEDNKIQRYADERILRYKGDIQFELRLKKLQDELKAA